MNIQKTGSMVVKEQLMCQRLKCKRRQLWLTHDSRINNSNSSHIRLINKSDTFAQHRLSLCLDRR